jgi:acetyl-CoA carboxylase beta subunit
MKTKGIYSPPFVRAAPAQVAGCCMSCDKCKGLIYVITLRTFEIRMCSDCAKHVAQEIRERDI